MSVTAAEGFQAAGLACGIKPDGRPDLALVVTSDHRPVTAAGVFTSNRVAAAPVQVSRRHLDDGRAAAVVLNSGNANAATGEPGRVAARRMCELTAAGLGCEAADVLVCSTGLIGVPLPTGPLEAGIPALTDALGAGGREEGARAAAEAIMTTDTVAKEATANVAGSGAMVGGMAKGAAMLAPAMATMLAVVTTDAAVEAGALREALAVAVESSFNHLCIDGAQSTNDTVIALAGGAVGGRAIGVGGSAFHAFVDALGTVCASLAEQMALDAEGATKLARIVVRGARSPADARRAARAVALSQLVQCSLNGEDPYWGRVLAELGASGAELDPEGVDIAYNGVVVCRDGVAAPHDAAAVAAAMRRREIEIRCDLHRGDHDSVVTTTDLSYGYIDENRTTS